MKRYFVKLPLICSFAAICLSPTPLYGKSKKSEKYEFAGKEYTKVKVLSYNKDTGIVQIEHAWGAKGINIDDISLEDRSRLGIKAEGTAASRKNARSEENAAIAKAVAEENLAIAKRDAEKASVEGAERVQDVAKAKKVQRSIADEAKSVLSAYSSVKGMKYVDLMSSSRKISVLRKYQGQTVLIRVGKKTFDYSVGRSKNHAKIAHHKGLALWARSNNPGEQGFYVATIPHFWNVRIVANFEDGFEVLRIGRKVSSDLKFLQKVKAANNLTK